MRNFKLLNLKFMAVRVSHTQECRFGFMFLKHFIIKKNFKQEFIYFVGPWVAEFSIIGYYRKKKQLN